MAEFKIIYYVVLVMSFLLLTVFLWGAFTYNKVKSDVKFLNRPLLTLTLSIGIIGFILSWIPIFMKIWTYDDSFVRTDPAFISILVFEFLFLVGFLSLSYIFAFDFGIALEQDAQRLQFFGQTVSTNKIIALEEKKYSLKIVYEQGFKNIKKKVTIFSPNAKIFVREILAEIVAANQATKEKELNVENATIEDITIKEKTSVDTSTIDVDAISTTQNIENENNS